MNQSKTVLWLLHIVSLLILTLFFGFLYFWSHAWGTWGDDSAGYIFLAGRMHQEQPLVYNDPLATEGIQFFENEKFARWLIPTHHGFINPNGTIASKYPIGSSMLMYASALLTGSSEGFYLVTPALAVLNLILVYILAQIIFPKQRFRWFIGLGAALTMGLSNLYFEHAVAQPMREIPSITFLLLFAIFFVLGLQYLESKRRWLPFVFTALSALSIGMAINIRETSIVLLPIAVAFGMIAGWQKKNQTWKNIKRLLPHFGTFIAALIIGLLPTIWNSYTISVNKVAFKARDTQGASLLSNENHIQSLSFSNMFDNQGKFAEGEGSLPHYWDVMQHLSPIVYLLLFAVIGLWFLWKRDQWGKATAVFLCGWILSTLFIFSIWINPYSRYIMPLLPPLMLLAGYGAYVSMTKIIPSLFSDIKYSKVIQTIVGAAIGITLIMSYNPMIEQLSREFAMDPPYMRFKSITRNDLHQLMEIGNTVQQSQKQPVLMFSGEWQFGTSETFEAHTGVQAIRYPLEQRYVPPVSQVNDFIKNNILPDQDLYVWADSTSSQEFYNWLEKQNSELIAEYDFSFQSDVRMYHVKL